MDAGIYDSEAHQQRQKWVPGEIEGYPYIVGTMNREIIEQWHAENKPIEPWGTYPDVPKMGGT